MDNFIVSARKYRPDTFDTVIGQESITSTLKNAIKSQHLSQAYLFCGPRGVGKTTCARILAKTINCQNLPDTIEACNHCESCKSFNGSRSFNIHELDAASNNKVDDIKSLMEQVRIPPQVGKYSIYIIDEVHMLSLAAFNSFLKTLEEPPPHAIFILATTEKQKIIPTILSRCQIFDFNRITIDDMVGQMESIAGKEGIDAEQEALHVIAAKADGSMRDALSIFDQIVSYSGKKLSYEVVIENLNVIDYEYYMKATEAFNRGDISASLLLFNDILESGFDGLNFIEGLAGYFRDVLVCKDLETLCLLEVGKRAKERYQEQAKSVSSEFLYRGLDILYDCKVNFKSQRNQRLHTELALMKLCYLGTPGQESSRKKESKESMNKSVEPEQKKTDKANVAHKPDGEKNDPPDIRTPKAVSGENSKSFSISAELNRATNLSGDVVEEKNAEQYDNPDEKTDKPELTQNALTEIWVSLGSRVESPRMAGIIQSLSPVIIDSGQIELTVKSDPQKKYVEENFRDKFIKEIKERFKVGKIEMRTIVEESRDDKKPFKEEEKLKHFIDKNPAFKKLKEDLNLDFE